MLSVVMPVYNQEVVLEETLTSIAVQTFCDYELLCVDDGSSDRSMEILKAQAAYDDRVRLLARPHEGAAKARNYGLSQAAGTYIIFLDSDDLFHPAFFESMVDALERTGADMCICEYDEFDHRDNRILSVYRFKPKLVEGLYMRSDLGGDVFKIGVGCPWNKMYRRDLIRSCGASFQDVRCSEDCLFTAKAIVAARTVYLLEKPLVRYRRGLGTSIEDRRHPFGADIVVVVEEMLRQVYDADALTPEEAEGFRRSCAFRLVRAASSAMHAGIYTEELHERIVEDLRETGAYGLPLHVCGSLGTALWLLLLKNATCGGAVWAHEHWRLLQPEEKHNPLHAMGYVARVLVSVIAGRLGFGKVR